MVMLCLQCNQAQRKWEKGATRQRKRESKYKTCLSGLATASHKNTAWSSIIQGISTEAMRSITGWRARTPSADTSHLLSTISHIWVQLFLTSEMVLPSALGSQERRQFHIPGLTWVWERRHQSPLPTLCLPRVRSSWLGWQLRMLRDWATCHTAGWASQASAATDPGCLKGKTSEGWITSSACWIAGKDKTKLTWEVVPIRVDKANKHQIYSKAPQKILIERKNKTNKKTKMNY